MQNPQQFIFVGQSGSIGATPLVYGDAFDADPDFIRGQKFPAVPADMLHVGYTQIEAGMALVNFHSAPEVIHVPVPHSVLSNAAVGEGLVSENQENK